MRHVRPTALAISCALLAALPCRSVQAEVRVQGEARDVRVEARDATVAEILAGLSKRFALHYRGATAGGGVTATFEGPLRRVVERVLEGYNYVIEARGDVLDVIVLSASSGRAVPAPVFAPPTVPSKRQRDY